MFCVVLQIDGTTPLFVASCNGHVECVRALLDGGAAIDQAEVGYSRSMAWHCRGCVRGSFFACMGSSSGALGCHVVELGAIGRQRTPRPRMLH